MVQRVMGHERSSTTLDLYTRRTDNSDRILRALSPSGRFGSSPDQLVRGHPSPSMNVGTDCHAVSHSPRAPRQPDDRPVHRARTGRQARAAGAGDRQRDRGDSTPRRGSRAPGRNGAMTGRGPVRGQRLGRRDGFTATGRTIVRARCGAFPLVGHRGCAEAARATRAKSSYAAAPSSRVSFATSPGSCWRGRCCSPCTALRTWSPAVNPGTSH